ncbi:DsbA family protein [Rhodoferax saidenbachensis]|nr:DsbA family protein [Rhodoferax saidenbachensis]
MELLHFHDPMCSWCWAFRPTWQQLRAQLPADLPVRRVVGGLAPDSDVPMEPAMRAKLQSVWQMIQARVPGTPFNFDFWQNCTPRRSTYNACRAVLAAKRLAPESEEAMIVGIQEAYYLQAQNPSDISTLVEIAQSMGLDAEAFAAEVSGATVEAALQEELAFARQAPINGFPSLVLRTASGMYPIGLDYLDAAPMLLQIHTAMEAAR